MSSYRVEEAWPKSLHWVLPSPNMPHVSCANIYSGTVLLEGTSLSEGRGTCLPLEMLGMPEMKTKEILKSMEEEASFLFKHIYVRPCFFEPTFDKYKSKLCSGFQIHLKNTHFQSYRFISLFLKYFKKLHPETKWWTDPPYEYEYEKRPIDILSGSDFLYEWVERGGAFKELDEKLLQDEVLFEKERADFLIYK